MKTSENPKGFSKLGVENQLSFRRSHQNLTKYENEPSTLLFVRIPVNVV